MTDIFSTTKRSQIMSRIRSSDTTPEITLHLCVRRVLGGRWRIDQNVRTLPGQPDIVIRNLRLAIFADGCFYHSCPQHRHVPKSNEGYWIPKLQRNKAIDKANRKKLRKLGFIVWSFWEHDLKKSNLERTILGLHRRLSKLVAERRLAHPPGG